MAPSKNRNDDEAVVDLVRRLVGQGKAFSISIENPDDPIVERARNAAGDKGFLDSDDGNCTKWVYVPGVGNVCVEHG
jgi:hypothetical protein